ncbi:MAG: HXXEE domain-containing protein [Enterococcus sp.]
MEKWIRRWYEFAVYIAGVFAVILALGNWNFEQRILLIGLVLIHLHFFEEFGLPGGFAWGALKVEKGKVDPDVSEWPLNHSSALWGNEWFAISVYLLPLFVPQWHWAVLAAVVFAYAEFLIHVVVFPIGLKKFYNPGLFTALFGLTTVSTWYLYKVLPTGKFSWVDLIIAIVWIVFNYWMAFLSPIFVKFNDKKKYTFSKADVEKSKPYMDKFNASIDDLKNLH